MIEVLHDGNNLPFRRKVRVTNVKCAMSYLRAMMAEKRPRGMRLRYLEDPANSRIWIESRNQLQFDVAMCALRQAGYLNV